MEEGRLPGKFGRHLLQLCDCGRWLDPTHVAVHLNSKTHWAAMEKKNWLKLDAFGVCECGL